MKLFSKVMANRIKTAIPTLIDNDQTGFVNGRNIAENFIYAADLLSCCHKRKAPTAVLKLDFRKAFDSVSWTSLDAILECRGFDDRWRGWVQSILATGKTSVLLNGVPGPWINCKRGLRQGDPLSPYLFIIVADVLQCLVQRSCAHGDIQHPVDASLPCPVLQYADDTLLLVRGDVSAIVALKQVLDMFSRATGLDINYHKSTFVPMNISREDTVRMANILGCNIESFPQTYLGLPLTPHKIRVSDYQPLITRVDRYLAGWKARLLSTGGRLTLVNAVLSSLPIYFMSSTLMPKTVIDAIDGRRRSFLWTGEEKTHGSKCLVAWTRVCQDKAYGGLGVKDLACQNHCLLLKIIHKLHDPQDLPWKSWFLSQHGPELGKIDPDSYIARLVVEELPRYRLISRVIISDGKMTSFWHDKWLSHNTLAEMLPALYSHSVRPEILVADALLSHISTQLRPRLTNCAREEMRLLQDCLVHIALSASPDSRVFGSTSTTSFNTKEIYRILQGDRELDPDSERVWHTRVPKKIKIFGWLLHHGRLNSRGYMYHRNICSMEESNCERCTMTTETAEHIFRDCPVALNVWRCIGISVQRGHYNQSC